MAQLKNTTITGTLSTSGKATLNSAGVTGAATVGTTLSTGGKATLASAAVTNNATVGGTLGVTGKTTAKGDLQVNGDFYASGSVEDSTFTVNVPATFNKAVNAKTNFGYFGQLDLSNTTPYIDFHFNKSTADYTGRIIHSKSGVLEYITGKYGTIVQDGDAGYIYPGKSGNYGLGTADNRWHSISLKSSPNVSSLVELKENIRPFTTALEEIDKTDVYNYNLKACLERYGDDIIHTGFIIGDDYNLSKLLLGHGEDGIDLYNAIGITFGGVKELYELVKTQQNKIDEQQTKIEALENRLNALEEKINK